MQQHINGMQGSMNEQQWMDEMRKMGMSNAMIMRCRMMNATQVNAYDPASVLAYQTGLGLSDEQVKKIQDIAAQARREVKSVPSQDQLDKLRPMATGPQSWTQMYQWMMHRPQQTGASWVSVCPWMMWPATQPAQQPGANVPPPPQGRNMMGCPMRCW